MFWDKKDNNKNTQAPQKAQATPPQTYEEIKKQADNLKETIKKEITTLYNGTQHDTDLDNDENILWLKNKASDISALLGEYRTIRDLLYSAEESKKKVLVNQLVTLPETQKLIEALLQKIEENKTKQN